MTRATDSGALLARAIELTAHKAGCAVRAEPHRWTRWASATFQGARHAVTVRGTRSPGLEAWLAALPDQDFALPGHLVADLVTQAVRRDGNAVEAELEVLTLEAR